MRIYVCADADTTDKRGQSGDFLPCGDQGRGESLVLVCEILNLGLQLGEPGLLALSTFKRGYGKGLSMCEEKKEWGGRQGTAFTLSIPLEEVSSLLFLCLGLLLISGTFLCAVGC